jgi:hypothetical protein
VPAHTHQLWDWSGHSFRAVLTLRLHTHQPRTVQVEPPVLGVPGMGGMPTEDQHGFAGLCRKPTQVEVMPLQSTLDAGGWLPLNGVYVYDSKGRRLSSMQ